MSEYYEYNEFPQYVTVAERKKKALALIKKLQKTQKLNPVTTNHRTKIANSYWGQSWVRAIESYEDFEYRLPRGRSYLRHGSVIDLQISGQTILAKVLGSELYQVNISFEKLTEKYKNQFIGACTSEFPSLVDLLSGNIPDQVSHRMVDPEIGLFPKKEDLSFECNCPDYADLCKHIAATLYGIGVLFDTKPEVFFELRGIRPEELVHSSADNLLHPSMNVSDSSLEDLFGIEIENESSGK